MQRQLITAPTPRLLGAAQAAAFLGIGARMFDAMWRRGELPAPHRLGRRVLRDIKILDQFVDTLSGLQRAPSKQEDEWNW